MTILKHIKHNEIDFTKWDKTILSSEFPFVFAQSYYLNATSPGWEALIIGDYESVFPLTIKTKFGYKYLPQPPFTSQLGAFGKLTLETELLFYNFIIENFTLIDVELNYSNQLKNEFISPKKTYILNYKNNFQFNKNTKRNITKAQNSGLLVQNVFGTDVLLLSQQYINPFLKEEIHLSDKTIKLLDNLLINAQKAQQVFTFKVIDDNGNIKAFGHFLSNGIHALYLKGVVLDRNENLGSMHLLIKHAIEYFADKSILFDFSGGSKKGLGDFYKGFGGEEMCYGFLQINSLPKILKLLKNKK